MLYNLPRVEHRAEAVGGGYAAPPLVLLRRVGHCALCTVCVGGVLYNLQRVERRAEAWAMQSRLCL